MATALGAHGWNRVIALLACALAPCFLTVSCATPTDNDGPIGAVAAPRAGQPTARELDFLLGAWRRTEERPVTAWSVWTRRPDGFRCDSYEAHRGVSRLVERMQLVLTLDGWRLTPVLYDELERPYESDPFHLAGWGDDWVRFERAEAGRARAISYQRTGVQALEVRILGPLTDRSSEANTLAFAAMGANGEVLAPSEAASPRLRD